MKSAIFVALGFLASIGFAADKRVAVFVQNRTQTAGMDAAVGGVRERLIGSIAEIPGFTVVDSTLATDAFNGSPNVAKQIGCDYVAVAGIVGAGSVKRNMGGRLNTVFTLRMTLKITDVNGDSVDGLPAWFRAFPVLDAVDDPMNYYENLFDQWAADVTAALAVKAPKWRSPAEIKANEVGFHVSTSIDKTIAELESQTKGTKGEQLVELRKVVGCAAVELDGVVIGSAPGDFKAGKGLHKIRVTRAWMKPYEATVSVAEGVNLDVALELSDEGVAKWGSVEALRADLARRYAEAAKERGIKINIDSSNWRDVGGADRIKLAQ